MDPLSSLLNEQNTMKRKSMENESMESAKEFYCEICKVTCNSKEKMDSHQNGLKHRVKEAQTTMIQKTCDEKEYKVDGNNDEKEGLWCKICNVKCSGKVTMISHLNGKKHKAKKLKTGANDGEVKDEVLKEEDDGDLQKKRENINVEKKDEEGSSETSVVGKITDGLWCLICKAKFRDGATLTKHVDGNYHKSEEGKLTRKKMRELAEANWINIMTTDSSVADLHQGKEKESLDYEQ